MMLLFAALLLLAVLLALTQARADEQLMPWNIAVDGTADFHAVGRHTHITELL